METIVAEVEEADGKEMAVPKRPMILFDQVFKRYPNGVCALKNVSFRIDEGEFVFLMGSSGAGKSTLIKLLMKEENVTSGKVVVDGMFLNKVRGMRIPRYRRNLGVVFQDFRLLPKRTVFDNVAFAMEITGTSRSLIRRRVALALSLVGLEAKEKDYPPHLSGGEQQRVALARAIVNTPRILIADEPTGNLDPENSNEIMSLLTHINQKGTTVLVATHERDLVERMGNRVIFLNHGQKQEDGQQKQGEESEKHEDSSDLFLYH